MKVTFNSEHVYEMQRLLIQGQTKNLEQIIEIAKPYNGWSFDPEQIESFNLEVDNDTFKEFAKNAVNYAVKVPRALQYIVSPLNGWAWQNLRCPTKVKIETDRFGLHMLADAIKAAPEHAATLLSPLNPWAWKWAGENVQLPKMPKDLLEDVRLKIPTDLYLAVVE